MARPTIEEHFSLRTKAEAQELVDALQVKGYLARMEFSGRCSTDADGNHYHANGVVVRLTPAQARRLAR